jgi:ribosomal protein S18 acetylase RimI-like enzyme
MFPDICHKLDNPAWYSLTEAHRHFATGNDTLKRYPGNIAPFVAFNPVRQDILAGLDELVSSSESFFFIGEIPIPATSLASAGYIIESRLDCVQMICTGKIQPTTTSMIEELSEVNDEEMLALINKVQPGYYYPRTRLMGDYYGIRNQGRLVAMAGERMRMDGLTEISAVVTDPAFTGRGYARQLVAHVANKNLLAGIIPFLHAAATNERAVRLYELLGFVHRRIIAKPGLLLVLILKPVCFVNTFHSKKMPEYFLTTRFI